MLPATAPVWLLLSRPSPPRREATAIQDDVLDSDDEGVLDSDVVGGAGASAEATRGCCGGGQRGGAARDLCLLTLPPHDAQDDVLDSDEEEMMSNPKAPPMNKDQVCAPALRGPSQAPLWGVRRELWVTEPRCQARGGWWRVNWWQLALAPASPLPWRPSPSRHLPFPDLPLLSLGRAVGPRSPGPTVPTRLYRHRRKPPPRQTPLLLIDMHVEHGTSTPL